MCEVSKIVEELRKNPVFCMSLASKELFHSNMLAWLLESRDSDDNLLSEIAKALAELFMPKQNSENGYKVLTVLREKSHFDLIIVFLPKDDYDSINNEDLLEIKDLFLNYKQPSNIQLLKQLRNDFRFAVVENKFKSIPNKEQLEKYNDTIKNGICFIDVKEPQEDKKRRKTLFSIVLNEENTTCYLMAPEIALDNFKEYQKCQECQEFPKYQDCPQYQNCPKWLPLPYEKIWNVLQSKIDDTAEDFTAKFIEHYANFLKNMLKLTEDIEKKLEDNKNHAFPDYWQDIFELKKIRIHDFYEKLWFSVLLNKITITDEKIKRILKTGSGYTNASGLLDFKITDEEKHVWRGVQIQQQQLRIELEPASKCVWKGNPDKAIKDYCYSVLGTMKENSGNNLLNFEHNRKNLEELHHFGEFKYRYIRLNPKITIEELAEMINYALEAIYNTSLDNFDLEAELKKK